jgi:hypothetical protein
METAMVKPRPYREWRADPTGRWRDVFHTFGHLLLTHARDGAIQSAAGKHKDVAAKAATDALYNLMMILEGVVGAEIDADHSIEFALVARVRRKAEEDAITEQFELAPGGAEPACMGFHLWTEGEFRV